jgi:hypothetical protein
VRLIRDVDRIRCQVHQHADLQEKLRRERSRVYARVRA